MEYDITYDGGIDVDNKIAKFNFVCSSFRETLRANKKITPDVVILYGCDNWGTNSETFKQDAGFRDGKITDFLEGRGKYGLNLLAGTSDIVLYSLEGEIGKNVDNGLSKTTSDNPVIDEHVKGKISFEERTFYDVA